jgi:hypothetical protein
MRVAATDVTRNGSSVAADELSRDELEGQRDRLLARLAVQRGEVTEMWGWYRGQEAPPVVDMKLRPAYQLLLDMSVTPWARLIIDTIAERLRLQGVFAGDNAEAARDAWQIFRRERMEGDQRVVYTEALVGGCGYVSVSELDGTVYINPESALEVTHEHASGSRREVSGALKLYPFDPERMWWVCELYRPEGTWRWATEIYRKMEVGMFPIDSARTGDIEWLPVGDPQPNPAGMVPMVPFENRLDVLGDGTSEVSDLIPVLRRIDKTTLDGLLAAEAASFRQRWATGLQVPKDEEGNPVEPYKAAVDRLWVSENPETRFGTFDASDIQQYLQAMDSHIATLAAISRVPAHYLLQRNLANPPSAESLIASEAPLNTKVEDHQSAYGDAWERVMYLTTVFGGFPVDLADLEVKWRAPERRNPAVVADSALKLMQVGWPQSAVWAYTGATPQQIEEWQRESAAMDLLRAAGAGPSPAAREQEGEAPAVPGEAE